jgi:hypothetical protein
MSTPATPTQTVRADRLVVDDVLLVPMTESIETVTRIRAVGSYVAVFTDGTGPAHSYMWAASEQVDVVSRSEGGA